MTIDFEKVLKGMKLIVFDQSLTKLSQMKIMISDLKIRILLWKQIIYVKSAKIMSRKKMIMVYICEDNTLVMRLKIQFLEERFTLRTRKAVLNTESTLIIELHMKMYLLDAIEPILVIFFNKIMHCLNQKFITFYKSQVMVLI